MTYVLVMAYVWGSQFSMLQLAEYSTAETCEAAAKLAGTDLDDRGWPVTGIVNGDSQSARFFCVPITTDGRRDAPL